MKTNIIYVCTILSIITLQMSCVTLESSKTSDEDYVKAPNNIESNVDFSSIFSGRDVSNSSYFIDPF